MLLRNPLVLAMLEWIIIFQVGGRTGEISQRWCGAIGLMVHPLYVYRRKFKFWFQVLQILYEGIAQTDTRRTLVSSKVLKLRVVEKM